ncbi:hypothetical protein ACFL1H_03560 [Nanoarchaeota archaeon]
MNQNENQEKGEGLSLVLEVIPGQATEGLVTVYHAGNYEDKTLKQLVDTSLAKDRKLEEEQILKDVKSQMSGKGKLLYRGQQIGKNPLDHAIKEKTDNGEEYWYVGLKAIKPQEGGLYARVLEAYR